MLSVLCILMQNFIFLIAALFIIITSDYEELQFTRDSGKIQNFHNVQNLKKNKVNFYKIK